MHLELNRPGRRSRPTDRPKRPPHLESRPSGPACVLLAVVEEQQRVAAELEEAATLRVGDAEERRERGVHHLGDLLGPRSSEAREALRHRGEAGDVDECERALDLAPRCRGLVSKPFQRQSGDEGDEVGRRLEESAVGRGRRHRWILLYRRSTAKRRSTGRLRVVTNGAATGRRELADVATAGELAGTPAVELGLRRDAEEVGDRVGRRRGQAVPEREGFDLAKRERETSDDEHVSDTRRCKTGVHPPPP